MGNEPLLDRAMMLLRSHSGRGICINCLAKPLGRSAEGVRAALARLEVYGGFTREFARCAICEKDRLLLRAD